MFPKIFGLFGFTVVRYFRGSEIRITQKNQSERISFQVYVSFSFFEEIMENFDEKVNNHKILETFKMFPLPFSVNFCNFLNVSKV